MTAHYRPCNGDEGDAFLGQCRNCRHDLDTGQEPNIPHLDRPTCCAWGITDRFYISMAIPEAGNYREEDLDTSVRPAKCKRWTHKDDPCGNLRDPVRDVPGQMMLLGDDACTS